MAMYMGGEAMKGERLGDLKALSDQIKWQERRMEKQRKKRGKVGIWGKLAKTFLPGAGHILDFVLDRYSQERYDLLSSKDKEALKAKETFYTSGQAGEFAEEFAKQEASEDTSFGEALLSQVADYGTSWAGQEMLSRTGAGSLMQKAKSKLPSWMTFGMPGAADPTKVAITDVPTVQLSQAAETAGDFLPSDQLLQSNRLFQAEGGYIPKYYGGGSVQGGNVTPTISEYFNMQGKSLGGSNKQSLAEMLGRK